MTKLLVASGSSDSVEIVNLDEENPDLICDDLPNLPVGMSYASGHLIGKIPIICGGEKYKCKCHTFENGSWNSTVGNPTECPKYMASAILTNSGGKDLLLFTGGYIYDALDTTHTLDANGWNSGQVQTLPVNRYGHCMVNINPSILLSNVLFAEAVE